MPVQKRPKNVGSMVLSQEENNLLFGLLEKGSYTLSSSFGHLLMEKQNKTTSIPEWDTVGVGVLCFVKHYPKKCYFFQLYNITQKEKVWEIELPNDFHLVKQSRLSPVERAIVTFETQNSTYCFCFAGYAEETERFVRLVGEWEENVEKKRLGPDGAKQKRSHNNATSAKWPEGIPLEKSVIGVPQNVRHHVHVGWNPGEGLQTFVQTDVDELDPSVRLLLNKLKLVREKLTDSEKKMIYDIVNSKLEKSADSSARISHTLPNQQSERPSSPQAPPSANGLTSRRRTRSLDENVSSSEPDNEKIAQINRSVPHPVSPRLPPPPPRTDNVESELIRQKVKDLIRQQAPPPPHPYPAPPPPIRILPENAESEQLEMRKTINTEEKKLEKPVPKKRELRTNKEADKSKSDSQPTLTEVGVSKQEFCCEWKSMGQPKLCQHCYRQINFNEIFDFDAKE